MIPLKTRITARREGLKSAPAILQKHLRSGFEAVGKRLQTSARSRMRKDTGTEQKSLKIEVSGSQLNLKLLVISRLVQAFVDAYGLKRGIFPDFRVNSNLYRWAERRLRNLPTRRVKTIGTPQGPHRSTHRRLKVVQRIHKVAGSGGPLNATRRQRAKMSDTKRLAFLVARAIYRRGRAGTMWHKKTMEANRSRIIREMSNAISRAANEMRRA